MRQKYSWAVFAVKKRSLKVIEDCVVLDSLVVECGAEDQWSKRNGRQWSKISCGQGSVEEDEEAAEEGPTRAWRWREWIATKGKWLI